MNIGSLKLAALLVVIAAGGGVAWQAQQGILHPQKAASAIVDEEDDSEDFFTRNSDPAPDEASEDNPREIKLASNAWETDQEPTERQRSAVPPGKFQRSQPKSPSLGSPIPARAKGSTPPSLASSEKPEDESLTEKSAPTPRIKTTHRRLEGDSSFESEPAARNEIEIPSTSDPEEVAADSDENADPFGDNAPVLLVGNQEDDEVAPRPRREAKPIAMPDEEPVADSTDDPFADSAPPELNVEPADKPGKARLRLQPEPEDETDAKSPSLTPRPEADEAAAESPRTRRRTKPVEEISEEPSETSDDPFAGSDPNGTIGLPTEIPDDEVKPDSGTTTDNLPAPRRRHATPAEDEDPHAEKTPRLLPVPEERHHADEKTPPVKRKPRANSSRDELPEDSPKGGLNNELNGFTIKTEELDGDGEPDRAAPKGLQQPRLTIEKVAPKQAVLGQPLIYSVIVKNAGSADAHHVTVEDRIPKGTKLEGTSPRAELIDKRLIWRLGTLKPDEQKKISVKVIPQEQGPIGSVAKVNFVAEIAAEIEITAPQLVLSIDTPSQVRLGDKLHMVFKVRNAGGADAENVVVRNIIPDGLRHPAGADLEYAMGTLPAGETREIKLDLIATKNGKVHNKTVVTGDHGLNLDEETPIEVIGEQLLLTRTGKNRLFIDKPAIFTSTVANEGTAAATKVMVAEVIPAGLEFVSASDNGKFDPTTRAVTWSLGPIGPGEELKLSTKLMPKQLGDYRATITVTGPAGSVATVDAEMKVDGFPAVAVDSKSDTRLISVGERSIIRVHCKNQGTAAAKNLILSAELPPELRLVDGKGPSAWAQQGNMITFEALDSLAPSDTATFEIRVEGLTEGDTRIELQISADHLTRPLRRDETIRVSPESE